MRITGIAVLMVVAAGAQAGTRPAESRSLPICMEKVARDDGIQAEARRVASRVFAEIEVEIQWRGPSKCPSDAIYISFTDKIPAGVPSGALAYALPYEGKHIVVFPDRVRSLAPYAGRCLLGYTLAHEVTHILEGIVRHSESGIMKARWDANDNFLMMMGRFTFAPEDVELICLGLDRRELRASAAASRAQVE